MKIVRDFLNAHPCGVLATADGAGQPHAAVVYYSLQDDFSFLFGTKAETQKYKNIEENKHVAFVIFDEKEQATVQITGRVTIVEDPDMRQEAINNMFTASATRSQREIPPADKLFAGDYVILKLLPVVIRMAVYARPDVDGDDELYETLLFSEE